MSTKKENRFNIEKLLLFIVILLGASVLVALFVTVTSAKDSSYELLSPSVYQGDTLAADDFIKVKSSISGCSAEFVDVPDTSVPGVHEVKLIVDGNWGYSRSVRCSYTVDPVILDSVTLEAGISEIPLDSFVVPGLPEDVIKRLDPRITNISPDKDENGDYTISILVGVSGIRVPVRYVDTTSPTAEPKTVIVTNESEPPQPSDFVKNVSDASEVTFAFEEEYDFEYFGTFDVNVVLTDASSNTTTVNSKADCRIDRTPPTLEWEDNLYVTVGGTVSYLSGVVMSDNTGGKVNCTVNTDSVDYNTVGEYSVTYTATDEYGNSADFTRKLYVVDELPPDKEEVLAAAAEIYNKIVSDGMSKWDIAYEIFKWTNRKIYYVGTGIDKSSWLRAAKDGFETRRGDCFTYMSVSRAMLEYAGIPCLVVERDRHEGETRHYWLLVDIGDGWYHFDSCSRMACPKFVAFMRTDAELQWYRDNYAEHYYRFDPDAYPERNTNSYYNDILQSPTEVDK